MSDPAPIPSPPASAEALAAQLAADAAAFLADFGELVTYTPYGGSPVVLLAVVERDQPAAVTEDGKVLADDVDVTFLNSADPTQGVATVTRGRDTFTTAGRYGGTPRAHTVAAVISGDAGLWTVRVR